VRGLKRSERFPRNSLRKAEAGLGRRISRLPKQQSVRLVTLFLVVLAIVPVAHADSNYWIPTFGVSWASQRIYVQMPSEPGDARDVVLRAMSIWNQAQEWFRDTYFPSPGVDTYTFVLGGYNSSVLTDFTDYWTVSNYCPNMPFGVEGCTHLHWDLASNITFALVYLDTKGLTSNESSHEPIFLALHEFGHALGLPDLPSSSYASCPFQDLMCLYYQDEYPSTLDLYALHQLAAGIRATDVVLPSFIPYAYYTPISNSAPTTREQLETTQASLGPVSGHTLNPGLTMGLLENSYMEWRLGVILASAVSVALLVLFTVTQERRKKRRDSRVP